MKQKSCFSYEEITFKPIEKDFPREQTPDKDTVVTYFSTYTELEQYMTRLGLFHMDLTLDRMERFWKTRKTPEFPIIHIVGTNGKGSTSTFLCSIARAHGFKVGLFTSPHFLTPRERVQVNRALLPESTWVELANEILSTPDGKNLTYFEFQTCLAMLAFERENVTFAIMEAGLGGVFDATNVFHPSMTLFTPIGLDHEAILGSTLTEIAKDKAGAIHAGGVAMTGAQEAEALVQLQNRAERVGARLLYAVDTAAPLETQDIGLKGLHQTANARLALAAWRWYSADQGFKTSFESEKFGLESAFIPGRMQHVTIDGQSYILDGAHNSHALEALSRSLVAEGIQPGAIIFTCMADKNLHPMIPFLKGMTDGPIYIPHMTNERACDPVKLVNTIGSNTFEIDSMGKALIATQKEVSPVLICGSLYLLAELYTVYPDFLTP